MFVVCVCLQIWPRKNGGGVLITNSAVDHVEKDREKREKSSFLPLCLACLPLLFALR